MPAYKDKDGRWRYRFSYQGKRYGGSTPKGANTKKMAEKLEAEHIEKLVARRFIGVMPTFKQFAARFLEHQGARVKPLTLDLQRRQIDHVLPTIGHVPLDGVGRAEVDGLIDAWHQNAAATTINARLGTLGKLLAVAVEWGLIAAIPKITPLKVSLETPRFLTDAEATALLAAASPTWRSMVLVGLRTGLRIGELRGLQWADVELAASQVIVRRTDPGVRKFESTSPKSGKFRFVPLTIETRASLVEHLANEKKTAGRAWSLSDWVWPRGRTRAETRGTSTCATAMIAMTKRAGITGCSWHTLRHSYASGLVMRGVPLRVVQELLGHASIRMTERYAHLSPGFGQHAAVAMLDTPIAASVTPPQLTSGTELGDRDIKPENVIDVEPGPDGSGDPPAKG